MSSLTDTYEKEQREFFLNTSAWVDIHPSQLLGQPYVLKDYDLHTAGCSKYYTLQRRRHD
jgi:protein arginine N-methyltransferase 1